MIRRLCILGSTGSIGQQALDVVSRLSRGNNPRFEIVGLAAGANAKLLASQIAEHQPNFASIQCQQSADELTSRLPELSFTQILSGDLGIHEMLERSKPDLVLNAIVGAAGLPPTLKTIELGIDLALANKESLVIGGHLVETALKVSQAKLIPVDSEHNALFQLIQGLSPDLITKMWITASGGALRDLPITAISKATPEMVLKHPNWAMGQRITVDSATLVNKAFEVIEAKWLFDLNWNQIEAIIHPQSLIHGLIELNDGSIHAHMGPPDMRIPIQHALSYPEPADMGFEKLDLTQSPLEFRAVEAARYPAYQIVVQSGQRGGSAPAVINAADEVAVDRFLRNEIPFGSIPEILQRVLDKHEILNDPSLDQLLESDRWARAEAQYC